MSVSRARAALDTEYALTLGNARIPARLFMLTTLPLPRSIICGSSAWHINIGPRRFVSITRHQLSGSTSMKSPVAPPVPALFTNRSRPPRSRASAATSAP